MRQRQNNVPHFVSRYGETWAGKKFLSGFEREENTVKLSSLKKGECFSPPFKRSLSFKLSDQNLYFNLDGYKEHPHTIEHEDPDVLVTKRPEYQWDFENNTFIKI